MKLRLWFQLVFFAFLTFALINTAATQAWAQRIVFERSDALYSSGEDGAEPRKLVSLGGKPGVTLWAASPDGRRLAWLVQAGTGDQPDFASRPATVYVTDLLTARHQKKLFSTDALRDRLGRKVGGLGTVAGSGDDALAAGKWENWTPASLGWSADSRTLYVGCSTIFSPITKVMATFVVDAASGAALVDAEGKWKSLAPLAHIDADGGLLVGLARRPLAPPGSDIPEPARGAIEVVNLVEGTRTPLWKMAGNDAPPTDQLAQSPALHPDHRHIAYASGFRGGGLWLTDRFPTAGAAPRRLIEGAVRRPRWSSDGKRILFLYLRPGSTTETDVYDLYDLVVADKTPTPRLLLQSIYWFDTLAE